jgi:hypothetical protein
VQKLLGTLPFVSRTFEGYFRDTPYVLDMDANLYIGPADDVSRDEHAAVEVIFHFLFETGHVEVPVRDLLRDRCLLLDAFDAFDRVRVDDEEHEFRILLHGTYDGDSLTTEEDDDIPAGPCGQAVNQVKLRFYRACQRLDPEFPSRTLSDSQRRAEKRVLDSAYNKD